jgi:hypothetical protein
MIENYLEVKVPIDMNQDRSLITNKTVKVYFDWFLNIKEDRIKIFYNEIFKTKDVKLSINNLTQIYIFLKENIKVRTLNQEKIDKEQEKLPQQIRDIHKIDNYEFIEPTYSIIFDSGIYFGELLRKEILGLEWKPEMNRRMVYFGKPVLEKEGIKGSLEPIAIMYILANQMYKGTINSNRLIDLYVTWENIFNGTPIDHAKNIKE